MKPVFYLMPFILLLMSACKDENVTTGEPHQWLHYFAFVNDENGDFFNENTAYSNDSVFFFGNDKRFAFDDIQIIRGNHSYGLIAWAGKQHLISFGNGDIDTLSKTWEPSSISNPAASFDEVEIMRYYYNGVFVNEWDFKANPGLRQELKNRNTPRRPATSAENPIIILLPKDPDPEEFE